MELEKTIKDKSWSKIVMKAEKIYYAFLSWENSPKVPFQNLNNHSQFKWIYISLGKTRDSLDERDSDKSPDNKDTKKDNKRDVKRDVKRDKRDNKKDKKTPPSLSI